MSLEDENRITYFAETDYRNSRTKFGIKAKDRSRHLYTIGKTGMGKSTLLENMAIQDIENGEGLGFIDPHGGTAEKLLDYVPEDRIKDVVYFAPFDMEYPISFNVMEDIGADKRHLVASGLMSSFKKIWVDAWSARMEYILNNILLALLEYPDSTLLGVNRMLSDKEYRKKVVENISDPSVRSFWVDEFAKYGDKYMQEAGAAIQNKIGQFTANPIIRNIIGQPKSSFDIRQIMDEKKILIMNLSKGRVGEQNAALLGGMLITKIYLGAMSRADASAKELSRLPNFYFYVDEFQSFASDSFADILSEARKYKLNLTIAHQYVEQMSEEVRAAVFGNVGTMVVFRVGSFDAEIFEKEFAPQFVADDIVNLGQYQMYLRLMIDGVGSKPFSARGMAPIVAPAHSNKETIIEYSRKNNAQPRAQIEESIKMWHEPIMAPRKEERMKKFGDGQDGGADRGGERSLERNFPQREAGAPQGRIDYPPQRNNYSPNYSQNNSSNSSTGNFANNPGNNFANNPGRNYPRNNDNFQNNDRRPQRDNYQSQNPPQNDRPRYQEPERPRFSPPQSSVQSRPQQASHSQPDIVPAHAPSATLVAPKKTVIDKTTLKDILQKLEKEEVAMAEPAVKPVLTTSVKPVTMPLSKLPGSNDKSASKNKLSELKNVLQKLNKDAEKKVEEAKVSQIHEPAPKKHINKDDDVPMPPHRKPKEVPEDVLKKILE